MGRMIATSMLSGISYVMSIWSFLLKDIPAKDSCLMVGVSVDGMCPLMKPADSREPLRRQDRRSSRGRGAE
jgi:hypothetical protein